MLENFVSNCKADEKAKIHCGFPSCKLLTAMQCLFSKGELSPPSPPFPLTQKQNQKVSFHLYKEIVALELLLRILIQARILA